MKRAFLEQYGWAWSMPGMDVEMARRLSSGQAEHFAASAVPFMSRIAPHLQRGHRVLDLGCGAGRFALPMAKLVDSVALVDVSPEMLHFAREYCAEVAFKISTWVIDGPELPFSRREFDVICALWFFQHLDYFDAQALLTECARVLDPDGVIIANFPNADHPGNDALFSGNNPPQGPGRMRPYNFSMIQAMARRAGLRICQDQVGGDMEITFQRAAKVTSVTSVTSTSVTNAIKPTGGPALLQLGRYGDIINILPVAKAMAEQLGHPTPLIVHPDFENVLDGVSYVKPELASHCVYMDVHKARVQYADKYDPITVTQVSGINYSIVTQTPSFSMEAWAQTGLLKQYHDLPLVFDRRNETREQTLRWNYAITKGHSKPRLLVTVDSFSSPFAQGGALFIHLKEKWSEVFEILLLPRAHRIFDLLGLFEYSDILITADTAALHLAAATNLPVIALIQDRDPSGRPDNWFGTIPRCAVLGEIKYSDFSLFSVDKLLSQWLLPKEFIHVYSEYRSGDKDTIRRHKLAQSTWYDLNLLDCPVWDGDLLRQFHDGKRTLPFIRDLIAAGLQKSKSPDDVIILTNRDTCLSPLFQTRVRKRIAGGAQAMYSYRRDFTTLTEPLTDTAIRSGEFYPGCDCFIFTVRWWGQHGHAFPDLLLGAEAWDFSFRELIKYADKAPHTGFNDLIYHENHYRLWEAEENRKTLPSQQHNRGRAREFLKSIGAYDGTLE